MKTFFKVFIVSFLCFFIAFSMGFGLYLKGNNIMLGNSIRLGSSDNVDSKGNLLNKSQKSTVENKKYSSLKEAYRKDSRINFLILGMEDIRSDTLIFASLDPESKKADLIFIPRDTYIHRKGYNNGEQRKINSIYYNHGIEGVEKAVSYILEDVPIDHYIKIEYNGIKKIVDLIGGVEVNVPFHMKYKDTTAKPPVNIDIPEGRQILDGKQSLDFIRYRKGNDRMGYVDGDLGRIKAQQEFLKSFTAKSLDNIPILITEGYNYIDTDISLFQSISYGRNILGITENDINYSILPGEDDFLEINKKILSYYIYNSEDIRKVLEDIYNVKK